jgi:threonine/homoserine/homoserine lactone efflux protein
LTPGPVTTAIISQAPRLGWKSGLFVSIGHAITEFLMVVLITVGLSGVLGVPTVQSIIAILGGLLLIYMGGGMLIEALKGNLTLPNEINSGEELSAQRLLTLGIATSVSNPFWYAWWMTAAAVYLLEAKAIAWILVAGFFFGHISADFIWNLLLSTLIGSGRRFLNDRMYAALISACAVFLLYLAVQFLVSGFQGIIS